MQVARVTRSKRAARATYDKLSGWYDLLAKSEQRFMQSALLSLSPRQGESILEIGPGTGHGLVALAQAVGPFGLVVGLDLSPGMLAKARQKVLRAGLAQPVRFLCADGANLPLKGCCVGAVFVSFTLELFDTPEIRVVLDECWRVLRPDGRICVVSLAQNGGSRAMLNLYERAHELLPAWFDCRPILPEIALQESGFQIRETIQGSMWGLPVQTVLGEKH